ncbi:MAG: branched-chain amino acid ABC transporter permease [Clostridiales Family XIII bacterium]|jgi:branched-chain amino acid transport system permease protein|nr:branched-chain amino acid ABC transporter permease [Clostridiales Family XIII bacterium]
MFGELTQQILNGLVMGSYYILIAVGLSIVFGVLSIPHFAHGSVVMVGGYVTFIFVNKLGVPFILAMLISMILCAAFGILLERSAYRPVRNAPPINAFIVALGLVMIIDNLMTSIFGANQVIIKSPFKSTYTIGSAHVTSLRLFMIGACVVLVAALIIFMKYTKLGKAVRATSQNREASLIVGINTNVVTAIVFGLGSAFGAVAGSLIGALFAVYPTMGTFITQKGFAVLILGGLGSIPGAIVGGLIIGLTENLGSMFISSEYKDVFAFLIMIIILIFKPSGLFGGKGK